MGPGSVVLSIVVNFNADQLLEACVGSLARQFDGSTLDHHIIVWENGSARSALGLPLGCERMQGSAHIYYAGGQGNLGYARAVNTAYEHWRRLTHRTPLAVHCANPDTVSLPGALSGLLQHLLTAGWGAAGPALTFSDGTPRPTAYPALTPLHVIIHLLGLRLYSRFGRRARTMRPHQVAAVDGAYVVFSHEAWAAVSGLDAQFGICSDDHDICKRLRQRGWEIGVVPASVVHHVGAATRSSRPLLCELDLIQGSLRYIGKFHPRTVPIMRAAIAGILVRKRGPHSRALAWWAVRAPLQFAPNPPQVDLRLLLVLRRMKSSRYAAQLYEGLAAEALGDRKHGDGQHQRGHL